MVAGLPEPELEMEPEPEPELEMDMGAGWGSLLFRITSTITSRITASFRSFAGPGSLPR
jgi:hypothetical protein